ncbi:hypothetical protein KC19_1G296500 [Ceratodon purpureus]|uniref:U3 small nucleolar RNA-associated protein 25 n=1 Tax=Ceratodon purpureus TaxID=3225 RepID=A0A8T0JAR5_CERPU|nr:hypothetical protein KC19_1G296500 [Ceratodon purpureus]
MKRKHGSSGGGGGGGGRGGGRGGRGGRGGGGRGGRGRGGGGRGRGDGGRGKRSRNQIDYEPQPEVRPAQVTEGNVSSEEEEEVEYEEPASDYTTLLQTLQATNESFAKAYAPRRREEGGESSDDEEVSDSEVEDVDGSELEDELDGEIAEEDGEDAEGEEDGDDVEDGDSEEGSSSESEWEEVKDGEEIDMEDAEEAAEEEESDEDSDSERLSSGANAGTCEDPFKKHLELELADKKIAELAEGKVKFKAEVIAAGLPNGKWLSNISSFPKVEKNLGNCALKDRLLKHWQGIPGHKQFGDFQSEAQAQFFAFCNNYEDILLTQRCGPHITVASNEQHQAYVDAYVLHILNHVLKTRDLVTKNNEKLQRLQAASGENGKKGTDFIDAPRDQGFTRPKVLVLLPMRSTALKFVKKMIELAPKAQTVDIEHKTRFFDDFGAEDDEDEEDNHDGDAEQEEGNGYKGGKPADYKALFSGNNDDHFRIGIKFTRKSIKLYSDFYSSDIIVASPLGLITQIGEAETAKKESKADVDFLSSIEIVVMDYTDVILMQNWQHVVTLFDHLNRIPQAQRGTDFMRIREWFLNGHSRHYRQTLILSTYPDAKLNGFFNRSCLNYAGKIKLKVEYPGVLSKVMLKIRQVYERIECKAVTELYDARFEHFTKQVFPRIKDSHKGGILVIANFLDMSRIRNFLTAQNASFCDLNEYTKQSDISRARSWFYHKKRHFMLYTERAHFYHRYKIRGINELIFYSLPDHAQFYSEIANLLEGFSSCTVFFSKFDIFQLERIVGSTYANRMIESKKGTFTFM